MDFTKATDQQIKTIIEGDVGVPTPLLKQAFEEAMTRKLFDGKIKAHIITFFKNERNAEFLTGMFVEDLIWICYELGFEYMDNYKPVKPFGGFWYTVIVRRLRDITRDNNAQKRTGEVYSLEDTHEWNLPGYTHTESTALRRVYIDSLMNQLTDTEKEIVIMRYQGYYLREIGEKQGMSRGGIQKRIELYLKRLKGA